MRRPLLAVLTATLTLLPTAALAHPSFNPNEVAAGTPTQAILIVPHGCAPDGGVAEDGGASLATIELALQLPDGVLVEPGEVDGWDTSVQDGAVVWSDAGGATTDVLELPVTITAAPDATPDQEMAAFQQCEGDQFLRWGAGADDYPPVRLTVAASGGGEDPTEPTESTDPTEGHASEPTDLESTEDHGSTEDDGYGTDTASEEAHGPTSIGDPLPAGAHALAGERADGTATVATVVIVALLVLLLVSGLAAIRRDRP
jgi:uncharacterized protein YcnI